MTVGTIVSICDGTSIQDGRYGRIVRIEGDTIYVQFHTGQEFESRQSLFAQWQLVNEQPVRKSRRAAGK